MPNGNSLKNTFIQEDCIEAMRKIPDNSVECIFADPPYNLQLKGELSRPDDSQVEAVTDNWDQFASFQAYDSFTKDWMTEARRILTPDGTIWVIGSYHNIFRVGYIMQNMGFWLLNDVVWTKSNPMPNFRGRRFTNAHETMIWAAKSEKSKHTFNYQGMKALNDDMQMRSDWYLPICSGKERLKDETGKKVHSTQKPESLLTRVILSSTLPGDTILDPFGGTGTTAAVAKRLGRNFICIERDPTYMQAAQDRVADIEILDPETLSLTPEKRSAPRIPFGYFVEQGIIPVGSHLYAPNKETFATVCADGTLLYKPSRDEAEAKKGSIHKVAAYIAGKATCNGWTFWSSQNSDESFTLIDDFRQEEIRNRSQPK